MKEVQKGMKLGIILLVLSLALFFQVNYPSTTLAQDKEVKVKPKDKRIIVRKGLVGDSVAITDEHSPLRFVKWAIWDVHETSAGGKYIVPWSRLETNSVSSERPFEIEVRFEQEHDEEIVPVQISGGLRPVNVEARKTDDPQVYRTRPFILVHASHENDEAQRRTEMAQVQAELNELENTGLEKEIEDLSKSYKENNDLLDELFRAGKNESAEWYQTVEDNKKVKSDITSKLIGAVEAKTQIAVARQRLENLKNGNNIFLDSRGDEGVPLEDLEVLNVPLFEGEFVQGLPAIDGAILRASYGESRAEAEASIFDYAVMDIEAAQIAPVVFRCPDGPEPPPLTATNGSVLVLSSKYILTVHAKYNVIGSYKGGRQPQLVLTVPGTDIRDSREIPESISGHSNITTFEFDTDSYAWKFDRVVEMLPEKNWFEQFLLVAPEENWVKRLDGKRYPLLIELAVQIPGGDCQRWNDKGVIGLIFQKAPLLKEILCYIKSEAKKRAKGDPPTIAQSRFFETLKTEFLAGYLDDPSSETGEEAAEEIGRGLEWDEAVYDEFKHGSKESRKYFLNLYVPQSVRNRYEGMPEYLEPATRFFRKSSTIIIDSEFLIGKDNLGRGVDFDVIGGGRNVTNAMHWGTGVKYSNLPPNGLREMFLGYELWHLEGWDVFGEDALNDLIAEEQGRLFGGRLREGVISDEAELIREMDAAFQEARAWVGSLLRIRQEELDRLILDPKLPLTRHHWHGPGQKMPPWRVGQSITGMIDKGWGADEIKESTLVQRLIEIYQLIYEADESPVELTQVMRNMTKGRYNSQFKKVKKKFDDFKYLEGEFGVIWELDLDSLDKGTP